MKENEQLYELTKSEIAEIAKDYHQDGLAEGFLAACKEMESLVLEFAATLAKDQASRTHVAVAEAVAKIISEKAKEENRDMGALGYRLYQASMRDND